MQPIATDLLFVVVSMNKVSKLAVEEDKFARTVYFILFFTYNATPPPVWACLHTWTKL